PFKLFLLLSTSLSLAEDPKNIIAAKVNGYIITAQDVLEAFEKLPRKIKEKPLPDLYPSIVNELINQHLITRQAYKEKLDLNKIVVDQIQKNKDQILARYWINNFLINQTKRENVEIFYNNYLKDFKSSKEFNASHILVKNEKEAFEILKKLKNKVKFSELAKSQSIGPSSKNEGKLGWFSSGQMVKEFEKAVFSLKKGEITKKPVKTKFGFHIILLNEVRNSKPKKLSEIQQNIINRIKKNSLSNLEKKLRKNRKIIINDFKDVAQKVNN
ncbi:MAG: peptidylprolyl isomerase, partial [Alphaproteobacteria bacterium]|nr:peptidylprolyl isomerase [Alphaproteobacteria bacterium]